MRIKRKALVAAFLFILCVTHFCCLSAQAGEGKASTQAADTSQSISSYRIGPQNVIQVKIFGDAGSNQIYQVDERGFIKHALLGSVEVGSMSIAEAEKSIEKKLTGDYFVDPRVTIFVLEHSHFSIIGEVRRPGTYEIQGKTSLIEAISMAGGFTPVANQAHVKIVRKNEDTKATFEIDTTRITNQGDLSNDASIEADDVVVVPKSFF
jgi:polysaccharide export outer membrane protein